MNKKEIIILVGNIGAGKSTICKKYVKEGYTIISRDAFRYMIGAGDYIFNMELEPIIKSATQKVLIEFCKNGVPIVYDETNVSKKLRKPTIKIAKKYGYTIQCVVLPILSKEESVNRRMTNPHGQNDEKIWNLIWEQFNLIYEYPKLNEGIDNVEDLGIIHEQ